MKITLNNNLMDVENDLTVFQVLRKFSEELTKQALCCKINEVVKDLDTKLNDNDIVQILTWDDEEGRKTYRHTTAHVLAQAIKNIYPTAKLAIGPALENSFYYDVEFKTPITTDDFVKIEQEMKKIIKANYSVERFVLSKKKAIKIMEEAKEFYKVEIVSELSDDAEISFYKQGEFQDLCAGPHLRRTGQIKAFKLTSLTGAYWRGNENNTMLSRIYGTSFPSKEELETYLNKLEEAKKRDHNKLGRELGIFMTDEKIGQGLPLLMPKGTKLMQILQNFVETEEEKRGYLFTKTPLMAKSDLYKVSGHWDHYRDGMFIIGDPEKDKEVLALRPMTCPFQYTIYNNGLKSYRDLPMRFAETSTLFRNENSGEMHGLIRVRQFTLSDGHIICTPEQLENEFKGALDLIYYILKSIGLLEDVTFRFSKYDPNDKKKYIDDEEAWQEAESIMKKILDDIGLDYKEAIGEAAFYGPKLDIQIKNVYGKEDTIITIQVDMFLAENFKMSYIDENGDERRPYIVHRSSIGCYERTIALLIEKFAGKLPLWMSPTQVKVLSLTDRTIKNVEDLCQELRNNGIRVEKDIRNETMRYKVREAKLEKIPYIVVIGDKDVENNVITVRDRQDQQYTMTHEDFIKLIKEKTLSKIIE